jgi:hypothetical protein
MTEFASCAECGQVHPMAGIELSFRRPDDFLLIPPEQREQRASANNDLCALWGDDDDGHRYFVRGLLPLLVATWPADYAIGVWLEISQAAFERIRTLWDDAGQAQEPAFPATLANALPFHASTLGLAGSLQLTGPDTRPEFRLYPSAHALFAEQQRGISAHRACAYSDWAR